MGTRSTFVDFPDAAMIPWFVMQSLQAVFRSRPFTDELRPLRDPGDYELLRAYLASGQQIATTSYGPIRFDAYGLNQGRRPTPLQVDEVIFPVVIAENPLRGRRMSTAMDVLATLYEATGGAQWTNNEGWLGAGSECDWDNVECNNGTVASLELAGNGLAGHVPSQLALLSTVRSLNLGAYWNETEQTAYHNSLSGYIPSELGLLTSLTEGLSVHLNSLSGCIPSELGLLTGLTQELNVRHNALSGYIPSELGRLTGLTLWLSVRVNALSGSIPSELGLLTDLTEVRAGTNSLSGSIPSELGLLTGLTSGLWVDTNALSGYIPPELGLLTGLTSGLWVYTNSLSGSIPSELGLLTGLTSGLSVGTNSLSGYIPSKLGLLTGLTSVSMRANSLSGYIPSELGLLTGLTSGLWADANALSGSIPSELGLLTGLTTLNVYNNGAISGVLPSEIGLAISLTTLNTYGNSISGVLPTEIGLATSLATLIMHSNSISGVLPTEIGLIPSLTTLHMYSNSISGALPSEIGLATSLDRLIMYYNSVSGVLPTEIGLATSLATLIMHSNSISGVLPLEIGLATSLDTLIMYYNSFSGVLPSEIGLATSLTALNMQSNALSGVLPSEIGLVTSLFELYLGGNSLSGVLPSQIGLATSLDRLNMHSNAFSGVLPSEMGLLTELSTLDVGGSSFIYPPSAEVDALCSNVTWCPGLSGCSVETADCPNAAVEGKFCPTPARLCGAPVDCSAFAQAVPSTADPTICIPCRQGAELLVILPIALLLLTCVGIALLRGAARTHPLPFRRWMGTLAILYYHCLNISLISLLRIRWPPTLLQIGRLLSLDDLISIPNLECAVASGSFGEGQELLLTFIMLSVKLFGVLLILAVAGCSVKCSSARRRDRRVRLSSILLIFVFLSMWSVLDSCGVLVVSAQPAKAAGQTWFMPEDAMLLSGEETSAACNAIGQRLCMYDALCPHGAGNRPLGLPYENPRRMPVDNLQYGRRWINAQCQIHELLWNVCDTDDCGDSMCVAQPSRTSSGGSLTEPRARRRCSEECCGHGWCTTPGVDNCKPHSCKGAYACCAQGHDGFITATSTLSSELSALALTMQTLAALLPFLLLGAALYLRRHVNAYARGIKTGSWTWLPFHQLEQRLVFFVMRFGTHAPKWQFALWLRQLLLLAIGSRTLSATIDQDRMWGWVQLSLSTAVVLSSLAWHMRQQPYLLAFHNSLESGLLALLALLLLLAFPCHAVAEPGPAVDTVMSILVLGSLVGGLAFAILDWRRTRGITTHSLDDMLIDGPIDERLRDGTIRLLSCRWLLKEAETALRKGPSGPAVLKRRQEMEVEFPSAFMKPEAAAELFRNGKRQVLVLSYGWLSSAEPDPYGSRLTLLRRYLANVEDAEECGLFMDHVCLPQKPRSTKEEQEVFERGLKSMGSLYASVTGTAVLQIKSVPARPADVDGRLIVCGLPASVDREELVDALGALGGEVRSCLVKREASSSSAEVQFATHAQAKVVTQLAKAKPAIQRTRTAASLLGARHTPARELAPLLRGATIFEAYNDKPYNTRGWCCFEEGVASVVASHLAQQGQLPPKHAEAEKSRPKLSTIDEDGAVHPFVVNKPPRDLIADIQDKVNDPDKVYFFQDSDRSEVKRQLLDFAEAIKRGVEQAVERNSASNRSAKVAAAEVQACDVSRPGSGEAGDAVTAMEKAAVVVEDFEAMGPLVA